jgi:hypothetical protein
MALFPPNRDRCDRSINDITSLFHGMIFTSEEMPRMEGMEVDNQDEWDTTFSPSSDRTTISTSSTFSSDPADIEEAEMQDSSDSDESDTNGEFAVIVSGFIYRQEYPPFTQVSASHLAAW